MRIDSFGSARAGYVHKYYTDAHVHTGKLHTDEYLRGAKYELENIFNDSIQITSRNQNQLWDASDIIISDADCLDILNGRPSADEFNGNKRLLEKFNLIKNSASIENYAPSEIDKKVRPLAVCETGYGSAGEIERLFKLYHDKFFGLKFHPEIFQKSVTDNYDVYLPYMRIAQKYKKPSLFHSDNKNSPYSSPAKMYEFAKRLKKDGINTPVIMGHMGMGSKSDNYAGLQILIDSIKNKDANLYADTAWVDEDVLVDSLKRLMKETKDGLSRIVFGTDAPLGKRGENYRPSYIGRIQRIQAKIRNDIELAPYAEEIIEKLFSKNAAKLFNIKQVKGKMQKNKFLVMASALTAAVAGTTASAVKKRGNNVGKAISLVG